MAQKLVTKTGSLDRSTQAFFNQLAPDWANSESPENKFKILELLSRLKFRDAEKIIDIGCGTGILFPFLLQLTSKKTTIIAIDFARSMLQLAKLKSDKRIKLLCADFHNLPLKPASVDMVIAFQMFPHVADKMQAIKQCREILKPGGQVAVIHLTGSSQINEYHAGLDGIVNTHKLPVAQQLKEMFEMENFHVTWARDNEQEYFVAAVKSALKN